MISSSGSLSRVDVDLRRVAEEVGVLAEEGVSLIGEAPLLLDDPFVHFDEPRLGFALELIRDAAAERQVILFSTDPGMARRAQQTCGDCTVIELDAPALIRAA